MTSRCTGLLAGLVLLLGASGGCSRRPEVPRNVILVTMDTLSAAHLSGYGYHRETSPNLDAFAATATVYTRAYAPASWTLPSHASIFTGKYPFEHGTRMFRGKELPYLSLRTTLHESHLTITEAMKAEGFQTAGFAANTSFLRPRWGFDQGFDAYESKFFTISGINKLALDWLQEHKDEPFFLFLNYMDTHIPYNSRRLAERPEFLAHAAGTQSKKILLDIQDEVLNREPYPAQSMELLRDAYDLSIANLDEGIARLLFKLKTLGIYEDSLIIFTSDHGEAFGQHDIIEHSRELYEEVIWVPLIVKSARQQKGKEVDTPISVASVPRIILSQLPKARAKRYLDNFPVAADSEPVLSEHSFTRRAKPGNKQPWLDRFDLELTALIEWPYKYIRSSRGEPRLYDLESDRAESENLVEREAEVAERLEQRLGKLKASRPEITAPDEVPAPLDDEDVENLKALGYL